MKRLAWVTDIHLNFLTHEAILEYCAGIVGMEPDALLVGGDIGEASSVGAYLEILEHVLDRPIYFVLGNHDFYRGSIGQVRREMDELSRSSRWLCWLPAAGVVQLTDETALVGHDGWSDGRWGDYFGSGVLLNDYLLIQELALLDPRERLARLNALGDEAADYLRLILPKALERHRRVVLLTHVPPFQAACWYEGRVADDEWLPHFSCKATGDAMYEVMQARPDRELLVLCGHTHGKGVAQVLPNLEVRTGGATYGAPEVQGIITLE